ncbi:hypothetical protein [Ralstonia wenshanensis]|uniref:hypothetical protein n=1 Tax=Ralstonia wenshanensis TaxID=2842456 RepID=UPI002AAD7ACD|nr:hypothetical protein [Ralstonia wenshanensis]MDY7508798.1 hypothetical protein [Ralstonia wenshanensis]
MASKPLRRLVFGHRDEATVEAVAFYAPDVRRMRTCIRQAGYEASDEDLAAAWLYFSQASAATWLTLPNDDGELLTSLLGGKFPPLVAAPPARAEWIGSLVETEDGSGDQILLLPADLTAAAGWMIEDVIEMDRLANGEIRLRKIAES